MTGVQTCALPIYPDDARRDGDDDGGDSPLREGNSLAVFSLPELFFSLSGFRLVEATKNYSSIPPMFLGQRIVVRQRGAGGGPQGPGVGPTHGQGWTRGSRPPLLPGARLCAPF